MEKGMDLYPTLANNYALVRQHGNSIIFPLGSENEGQYLTPQCISSDGQYGGNGAIYGGSFLVKNQDIIST